MKSISKASTLILVALCLIFITGAGTTACSTKDQDKELVMITLSDIPADVIRIRLLNEYGYISEEYEEGDDDSLDYDAYSAAKRDVVKSLYASAADELIRDAQIDRSDIRSFGEYTGTLIAYLSSEKIADLKKSDRVDKIEPFSDNEEQPAAVIVPDQVE